LHADFQNGFVPGAFPTFKSKRKSGDYHNEMNFKIFLDWVEKQLLHKL
jgi:hypothetical protein